MGQLKKIVTSMIVILLAFACLQPILAETTSSVELEVDATAPVSKEKTFSLKVTTHHSTGSVEMDFPEQISFIGVDDEHAVVTEDGQHVSVTWPNDSSETKQIVLQLQAKEAGDFSVSAYTTDAQAQADIHVAETQGDSVENADPLTDGENTEQAGTANDEIQKDEEVQENDAVQNSDDQSVNNVKTEGWTEQTTFGYSSIPLNDSTSLRFQFGGSELMGENVSKSTTNDMLAVNYIPNVYFIDNGKEINSLYEMSGELLSSRIAFSNGKNDSHELFSLALRAKNPHYYTKEQANGIQAEKLTVDITLYQHSATFSMEMYGRSDGTVLVTESLTNNDTSAIADFSMLNIDDTKLNGDDDVTIHYMGDDQGLYIESGKYRLNYYFNQQYCFPNWVGSNFDMYSSNPFEKAFPAGNHYDEPGQEINHGEAGANAFTASDSAIYFKSQPQTLNPGETMTYDYVVSIEDNFVPKVSLDQNTGETIPYYGDDFKISGTWRDTDSSTMDLYYKVDGGTPVLFSNDAPKNTTETAFTYEIPSSQIISGEPEIGKEHTIEVYAIDPDGNQSNLATAVLKEANSTVKARYVDIDGKELHESVVYNGKPGEAYQTEQLAIDGYTFNHVEGNTKGNFTEAPITVTYVYRENPYIASLTATKTDGTTAVTVQPGETIHYQLTLTPPFSQENSNYYQTATFSFNEIDQHLTNITNIQFTDSTGQTIGTGQFDSQQAKIQATLTNQNVPRNQALKVSFDATVDPNTASGTTITEKAAVSGALTDQTSFQVDSNEITVTVNEGSLAFVSAPDEISFGADTGEPIPNKNESYFGHLSDGALIVQDQRSAGHNWSLTVRLEEPLTGIDRHDQLNDCLFYYHDGAKYMLSTTTAAPVMTGSSATHQPINISDKWDEKQEGLELEIASEQPYSETYNGTLSWALQDAP
ncbi:MucBP domain-containing protein [Listeria costaricensis]|uniref:MucBP domain-containing protein n=1 Tax=Listeria costaricensis TaxID=2026604 RepID=UPI000C08BD61|nr:MucBP domain-containing protein [Listeria costaricensis]